MSKTPVDITTLSPVILNAVRALHGAGLYPSIARIAARTDLPVYTVRLIVRALKDAGQWIKVSAAHIDADMSIDPGYCASCGLSFPVHQCAANRGRDGASLGIAGAICRECATTLAIDRGLAPPPGRRGPRDPDAAEIRALAEAIRADPDRGV